MLWNTCMRSVPRSLAVMIPGSHPGGPGSTPGAGDPFLLVHPYVISLLARYLSCSLHDTYNGLVRIPSHTRIAQPVTKIDPLSFNHLPCYLRTTLLHPFTPARQLITSLSPYASGHQSVSRWRHLQTSNEPHPCVYPTY